MRSSRDDMATTGEPEDVPAVPGKREAVEELERRREVALACGGVEKVQIQHDRGRLTVRERLALLYDPGTFVELGQLAHSDRPEVGERAVEDAVVTGVGLVDGRKVALIGID